MLLSCGGKNVNSQPENVQLLDVGGVETINLTLLWLIMSTLMMIRLLGNAMSMYSILDTDSDV